MPTFLQHVSAYRHAQRSEALQAARSISRTACSSSLRATIRASTAAMRMPAKLLASRYTRAAALQALAHRLTHRLASRYIAHGTQGIDCSASAKPVLSTGRVGGLSRPTLDRAVDLAHLQGESRAGKLRCRCHGARLVARDGTHDTTSGRGAESQGPPCRGLEWLHVHVRASGHGRPSWQRWSILPGRLCAIVSSGPEVSVLDTSLVGTPVDNGWNGRVRASV